LYTYHLLTVNYHLRLTSNVNSPSVVLHPNLFNTHPQVIALMPDCSIKIWNFLTVESVSSLYKYYSTYVHWDITEEHKFGKTYIQPRLHFYHVLPQLVPTQIRAAARGYKKVAHRVRKACRVSASLMAAAEQVTGVTYNSIFGSGQPCKGTKMGIHADSEPTYWHYSIADLSLGPETRTMTIMHKYSRQKFEIQLTPGSLMVMDGGVQNNFVHCVHDGPAPRIGLVMRVSKPLSEKDCKYMDSCKDSIHACGQWIEMSCLMFKHLNNLLAEQQARTKFIKDNRTFGSFPGFVYNI
jgi:hypothetical protein